MISSPTTSESWNLDALGNQKSVTLNGSTVTRAISSQNQIKSLSSSTTNLNYDADGNTINDQNGQQYKYDAWNRVVKVTTPGGDTIKYQYDALGRRITESDSAAGTTSDLYYSNQNQVIYEQIVNSNTGSITNDSYYWSPFYVNQLIARDSQTFYQATGVTDNAVGIINASSLRMYAQQDADYNVTSLTGASGAVVERYVYDPYGKVTVLSATGMVLSGSTVAWIYGFQGGRFDPAANLIQFDVREFNITTGTWLQQDPDKYVDGPNTYEFVKDNPGNYTDPSGESSTKQDYQNAALKRAGIDPSTWDPGKGFDSQKDNVNKVYDYYKSIFKANHNLKWAGLARLAGGAVVDGLKKIKAIKDKFQKKLDEARNRKNCLGQDDPDYSGMIVLSAALAMLDAYERQFLKIQKAIFMDLAWQHEAYLAGGLKEIQRLHDLNDGSIDSTMLKAWTQIDSGSTDGVQSGNLALLRKEQFSIVQPLYDDLTLTDYEGVIVGMMTKSFVPGAGSFSEVDVGEDENILNFFPRWMWINRSILPAWNSLSDAEQQKLADQPLGSTLQ